MSIEKNKEGKITLVAMISDGFSREPHIS